MYKITSFKENPVNRESMVYKEAVNIGPPLSLKIEWKSRRIIKEASANNEEQKVMELFWR